MCFLCFTGVLVTSEVPKLDITIMTAGYEVESSTAVAETNAADAILMSILNCLDHFVRVKVKQANRPVFMSTRH